jgi:polyhydroxyalkanoate synthesis repressor PhaR
MPAERTIKKYANRRLYDTKASRHVTLEEVRALIAAGESIKVIDDRSGEDITRTVLLQIIAEQEQSGGPLFTTAVLEQLIRFYGDDMQAFLRSYLEESVAAFVRQQHSLQGEVMKLMAQAPMAAFSELARQNFALWEKIAAGGAASNGRKKGE